MRHSNKNNRQRNRGRRNGNGQINRNTTLDSNGPDVRLRGNAFQLYEKYASLGNDAAAAGERISAEAYYQYADHYFRVHSAIVSTQEERRPGHPASGVPLASESHSASGVPLASEAENGATAADEALDMASEEKPAAAAEIQAVTSDDGDESDEANPPLGG